MSRGIRGFDYRSGTAVEKTRAEWRAELRAGIAGGGERRMVDGETFLFMPVARPQRPITHTLVFEIYRNVAV